MHGIFRRGRADEHGIVSHGMHDLFIAVPPDEIEHQVEILVHSMLEGLFPAG